MGVEYEWKFRAAPESLAIILADYAGDWQQIAMETTYYDTPNGDLARLHYTLRRRMENGKSVCTVKTPADRGGRGEWETEEVAIEILVHLVAALPHKGQNVVVHVLWGNLQLAGSRSSKDLLQAVEHLRKAIEYAQGNVSVAAICGWLTWALR